MKKRKIGNLEVTQIGMGTMVLSHGYGQIPDKAYSIEAVQKAIDYGCTFFDTAEAYGPNLEEPGHNELIVGEAVKGTRQNIVLATKFHYAPEDYADRTDLYMSVRRHLDASMKRLQTEYIDLYYLHRVNPNVSVERTAEVMDRLIREGLIGGWGLSQVSLETLKKAHEVTPVTAVQNLYNILERDCEEDIFPYCMENNIGVVPFSPIASGFLSGKITAQTEFEKVDDVRNWVPQLTKENIRGNQPILDIVKEYALKKDATPAQISLAWMLHKYPNAVPIPGSKNHERIIENLSADTVELTNEEFTAMDNKLSACKVYGHRGHVEDEGHGFLKKEPLR